MGLDLIDDRPTELAAGGHYVGSAWLLAVVVVTLLLIVAAPLL